MTQETNNGPFGLLLRLEERGRAHGAALPVEEDAKENWAGVGFGLGGSRYVVPMTEVLEILTFPDLSRVPRASSWVRGVANVRGVLLPIMDLNGYLGRGNSTITRLSRVMVIQHRNSQSGLVVDEILGMRHFFEEDWRDSECVEEPEAVRPYLAGMFVRGDQRWPVFSMGQLADHPGFLKVAG